jgi:hypothetical protein
MRIVLILFLVSFLAFTSAAQIDTTEFREADSIAAAYPKFSVNDLYKLSHLLTDSLGTETGKFRAIYVWVSRNIENDVDLFLLNQSKRWKLKDEAVLSAWNAKMREMVFKTLRKNHRTICTGYAYLIRELSRHAGIESVIVDGYGRTSRANIDAPARVNHSWNAVKLNGGWFLCDATWSSGVVDAATKTFIRKYDDVYFLCDPLLFIRNHFPIDPKWALLERAPTLDKFVSRPIFYIGALHCQLKGLIPDKLDIEVTRRDTLSIRFATGNAQVSKVALRIDDGATNIRPQNFQHQDGVYTLTHRFNRKGKFDLHVMINDQYALTYRLKVTDN